MKKNFFVTLFSLLVVIFLTFIISDNTAKSMSDKPQMLFKTSHDSVSPFAIRYRDGFRLFWEERESHGVSDIYVISLGLDGSVKNSPRNLTKNKDKQSRILSVTEINGVFHILTQNIILGSSRGYTNKYEYEAIMYNDFYSLVDRKPLYSRKNTDQFDKPSMSFDGEGIVLAYTKKIKGIYLSRDLYLQRYSTRWEKEGQEICIDFSKSDGEISDLVLFDEKGEGYLPPNNPFRIFDPRTPPEIVSGEGELKVQPQIFFRNGKFNVFLRAKTTVSIHMGLYMFQVEKDLSSYTGLALVSPLKYESYNFRVNHYNPAYEISLWENVVSKEREVLKKYKDDYDKDPVSRKLRLYQRYKRRCKMAEDILSESKKKDAFFILWEDYKTDHHKYLSSDKVIYRKVDKLSPSKYLSNVVKDGESYFYARVSEHFGKERLLLHRANIEELDYNKDIRISKSEDKPDTPFLVSYEEIPNNRDHNGDILKDYSEVIMTTCLFWSEEVDGKHQLMFRKLNF